MSISVYQRPNKKWKADVELHGLRKTKTFDKKIDATNWSRATERDLILNAATTTALQSKIVLTLREALQRYSDEVSIHKKLQKKNVSELIILKKSSPMLIGYSRLIKVNLLNNGKKQLLRDL